MTCFELSSQFNLSWLLLCGLLKHNYIEPHAGNGTKLIILEVKSPPRAEELLLMMMMNSV